MKKAYEIALNLNIDDDISNMLSFLDNVNGINEYMKEVWIIAIWKEIQIYRDKKQVWNEFKKSNGQKITKKAKAMFEAQEKKKIQRAKKLMEIIALPSLLNDSIDQAELKLRIELQYNIIKWEEDLSKKSANAVINFIAPSEPNKNSIKKTVQHIHKKYKIAKQSDNIRDLLPLI